jgi:glycosyltransferase involved in cell wall biosynthesis
MERYGQTMRICLVYDCLFPHTVGGAERWYRNLAERLVYDGHEVSYLTLRQWPRGASADLPGVRVVVVGPRMKLYAGAGRRRILPPLIFGLGILWHLLRHGRRYDVVHTASFPYFSLLAAALTRRRGRFSLVVDWHEVWTLAYWTEYLGRVGGRVGWLVQRACLRVPQQAFCFSRLHARRLSDEGLTMPATVLEGEYVGPMKPRPSDESDCVAVFAGRFIPEKRVEAIVPAIARARNALPGLRAELFGDGPERTRVILRVAECGLQDVIGVPGFVSGAELERGLAHALCMVLPSRREGYGMVVIEAASFGTPSIVVAGEDNAAVEHVQEGVNGVIAPSDRPEDLAEAITRVHRAGATLRRSTARWFADNAHRLSMEYSLTQVAAAYAGPSVRKPALAAQESAL